MLISSIKLIYDELPNLSEIALNMTPLAKVNIEEYYLTVNSNLNTGGSCTLLVTHGCIFDLFLLLQVLRNHAKYIRKKALSEGLLGQTPTECPMPIYYGT
eukprot:3311953-Pleurochrysis_carterae.AAC.3